MREEADESEFWLLFIKRARLSVEPRSEELLAESHELAAIFRAAYRTARRRQKRGRNDSAEGRIRQQPGA